MQKYTSANTSVNRSKVPAIYKNTLVGMHLSGAAKVLDFGCGRFDTGMDYARETFGCEVYGYDPYNRTEEYNMRALRQKYPIVLCSNVLNVIDSLKGRADVIKSMVYHCESNGLLFFSVYEGDRTGHGRQTGPDQWQENRPLKDYLFELTLILSYCKECGYCTGFCGPTVYKGVIYTMIIKRR